MRALVNAATSSLIALRTLVSAGIHRDAERPQVAAWSALGGYIRHPIRSTFTTPTSGRPRTPVGRTADLWCRLLQAGRRPP
jgi:hypothetical protein